LPEPRTGRAGSVAVAILTLRDGTPELIEAGQAAVGGMVSSHSLPTFAIAGLLTDGNRRG
jgi:hypothetical protein